MSRSKDDAARIAKLPRWARFEIEKLRANVEIWRAKALAATGTEGRTDTEVETIGDGSLPKMRGLPPGATVRFSIPRPAGPGYRSPFYVEVCAKAGVVLVRASDRMQIRPHASNSLGVVEDES